LKNEKKYLEECKIRFKFNNTPNYFCFKNNLLINNFISVKILLEEGIDINF
jgi:hypothetical protein